MPETERNSSHLLAKTFHSSMDTPTSILGLSSLGPRIGWACVLAGVVEWASVWFDSTAMAKTSDTSSVLNVQFGTEHAMTTMTPS